jgi:hypothetical protein
VRWEKRRKERRKEKEGKENKKIRKNFQTWKFLGRKIKNNLWSW